MRSGSIMILPKALVTAGIQKLFPIDLPDNYEFTFYVKAESPSNNFEINLLTAPEQCLVG